MDKELSTAPTYHSKDFTAYGSSQDNFVDSQGITVTITLNEYRNLLQQSVKAERDKVNTELRKVQTENDKLKQRNECLLEQLKKEPTAGATATNSTNETSL